MVTNLNLGSEWQIVSDPANTRLRIEHTPSGSVFDLNEDETTNIDALTVKGNDIDTNGDGVVDNADDADQVDGYDIAKDGVDGTGVINFKTS